MQLYRIGTGFMASLASILLFFALTTSTRVAYHLIPKPVEKILSFNVSRVPLTRLW